MRADRNELVHSSPSLSSEGKIEANPASNSISYIAASVAICAPIVALASPNATKTDNCNASCIS